MIPDNNVCSTTNITGGSKMFSCLLICVQILQMSSKYSFVKQDLFGESHELHFQYRNYLWNSDFLCQCKQIIKKPGMKKVGAV